MTVIVISTIWCSCREMSPFPPETKGSDTRIRRFNGYRIHAGSRWLNRQAAPSNLGISPTMERTSRKESPNSISMNLMRTRKRRITPKSKAKEDANALGKSLRKSKSSSTSSLSPMNSDGGAWLECNEVHRAPSKGPPLTSGRLIGYPIVRILPYGYRCVPIRLQGTP